MNAESKTDQFFPNPSSLLSREDVAHALHISDKTLRYILFVIRPENMYYHFEIPKKNGSYRQINAPNPQLKSIQKALANMLFSFYVKRKPVFGFIPGKNHIMNAKKHLRAGCVLNIDLLDYFSQFHFGRIVGTLTHPPYNLGDEAATTIAQIACLQGVLPQGAPSSPILTNIVCAPLDSALTHLAQKYNLIYTRYADDITFSAHKAIPHQLAYIDDDGIHLGNDLNNIIEKCNFKINFDKLTLHYAFQRQEVTGIVVNKKLNVRREYTRTLRSILHHCDVDGIYQTARVYASSAHCHSKKLQHLVNDKAKEEQVIQLFQRILWGKLNYVRTVRGEHDSLFLSLAEKYNKIFSTSEFESEFIGCPRSQIQKSVILECKDSAGEVLSQGSGFYLKNYGLLSCHHVFENVQYTHIEVRNLYDMDCGYYHISQEDLFSEDKTIDYVQFLSEKISQVPYFYEEGDSYSISVGQPIWLVSYPEYMSTHSTAQVLFAKVTQKKTKFGAPFFTVDKRITHGSSGGVVLNTRFEAIGMIRGGNPSNADSANEFESGFTPLCEILKHISSTMSI